MKSSLDIPEDAFKTRYSSPEEFASALRKAAAIYWYQRTEISQGRAKAVQQSKVKIRCRLQDLIDAQEMTRSALAQATGLTNATIRECGKEPRRFRHCYSFD
ncbi:UPF0175 family protein [Scytonema sp. NUACC26]|uniref:UPF0175 family protein n=1 Tax=Scytonema sp. NUACC26 TaxID=3140176 RepID=UPI0034DC7593